jgi:hypothetical protein
MQPEIMLPSSLSIKKQIYPNIQMPDYKILVLVLKLQMQEFGWFVFRLVTKQSSFITQ